VPSAAENSGRAKVNRFFAWLPNAEKAGKAA
jgi:hypothetical protein